MKAALSTRPTAQLNAKLAQLQQLSSNSTQQASGSVSSTRIMIYNGFFLDARVTTTYFCMMSLFIYFMVRQSTFFTAQSADERLV